MLYYTFDLSFKIINRSEGQTYVSAFFYTENIQAYRESYMGDFNIYVTD